LTGDRPSPIPIATSAAEEFGPRFSPDGRWISYESDESGRLEAYVQPFPPTGAKSLVSAGGGADVAWGGHELFYVSPRGVLTAVDVRGGPDFQFGPPSPLFTIASLRGAAQNMYDVTRDGKRFLIRDSGAPPPPSPIAVVFNWPALVPQK
jgi:eukaryotic-like serine/threonine-protein kinase